MYTDTGRTWAIRDGMMSLLYFITDVTINIFILYLHELRHNSLVGGHYSSIFLLFVVDSLNIIIEFCYNYVLTQSMDLKSSKKKKKWNAILSYFLTN